MSTRSHALRRTFSAGSIRRSILIAIIVGTVINAINQGPELLNGLHPVLWKLALSYFVPFAVASYGAYSAFRSTAE